MRPMFKSCSRDYIDYKLQFKHHSEYNLCMKVLPTLERMIADSTGAHVCACEEMYISAAYDAQTIIITYM